MANARRLSEAEEQSSKDLADAGDKVVRSKNAQITAAKSVALAIQREAASGDPLKVQLAQLAASHARVRARMNAMVKAGREIPPSMTASAAATQKAASALRRSSVEAKKNAAAIAATERATEKATEATRASTRASNQNATQINRSNSGVFAKIRSIRAGYLATAVAVGALTASVKRTVSEQITLGNVLGKQARAVGVSVAELQVYKSLMEQSGASAGSLKGAIAQLVSMIADAGDGSERAQKAFSRLGVSFRDSRGQLKSVSDIMPEIADGLRRVTNSVDRAGAAMVLFGEDSGPDMIAALEGGSRALEDQQTELGKINALMSRGYVEAAEAATKSSTKLEGAWNGLAQSEDVVRGITAVKNALTDMLTASGAFDLGKLFSGDRDFGPKDPPTKDRFDDLILEGPEEKSEKEIAAAKKTANAVRKAAGIKRKAEERAARRAEDVWKSALVKIRTHARKVASDFAREQDKDFAEASSAGVERRSAQAEQEIAEAEERAAELEKIKKSSIDRMIAEDARQTQSALRAMTFTKNAMTSVIREALAGGENMRSTMANVFSSIGDAAWSSALDMIGAEFAKRSAAQATATVETALSAGKIARSATETAATVADGTVELAVATSVAVGKGYEAHSDIPYIGVLLGAAAAAAIVAGILSQKRFAGGGIVTGGVPGVDSVQASLTPGETVLDVDTTRRMRALLNTSGGGGNGGPRLTFANGGAVTPDPRSDSREPQTRNVALTVNFSSLEIPNRAKWDRYVRDTIAPSIRRLQATGAI